MYRIILSWLLMMVFMAPQAALAAPINTASPELSNVRWLVHKDAADGTSKLRLVIDATGPVQIKNSRSENDSSQLKIDVQDAVLGKMDDTVALDGDIADKVTFIKKDSSSEILVDLPNIITDTDYKIFTLPSDMSNNKPFRVVIDIKKSALPVNNSSNTDLKDKAISKKVELSNFRWLVHKDAVEGTSKLRLVIDTTGPVQVNSILSENSSPQLTINVQDAVVDKIKGSIGLDGGIADKATFIKKEASSQIVVDLPNMIEDTDYKIFTLPSDISNNKPFRVVVDIDKPLPPVVYNFTAGLKNKIITIDAGHGGSDPGAIGPNKVQEKTITLAVAQKVKTLLERAGAKVLMTRQTDVDVYGPNATAVEELKARTLVANKNKSDVFVSIHINAFTNPTVGGLSTYYYKKSNYDVMLAKSIQDGLVKSVGLQDRGINAAGFYVVKRTEMPAVLAELGFISNPVEEKMMTVPRNQQKMAEGIVQGLENFFAQAAKKGGGS